jgi:hypothetical protein
MVVKLRSRPPMDTAEAPRSERLVQGTAYYLLRPIACPGKLELTDVHLRFTADQAVWLFAGIGGRRDFCLSTACIATLEVTSLWSGWRRGWPGRLLRIRLVPGRLLYFGVFRPKEWALRAGKLSPDPLSCESAERHFAAATRATAQDLALTSVAVAACLIGGWLWGQAVFFLALGVVVAGRMAGRSHWWLRRV